MEIGSTLPRGGYLSEREEEEPRQRSRTISTQEGGRRIEQCHQCLNGHRLVILLHGADRNTGVGGAGEEESQDLFYDDFGHPS